VILLGDPRVGKTSILERIAHNEFSPVTISTIQNYSTVIPFNSLDQTFELILWDTAQSNTKSCWNGADAAIIVFDVGNKKSFESAETYLIEFMAIMESTCNDAMNIPILLLGNKIDNPRVVTTKDIESYFANRRIGNVMYDECSASTSANSRKAIQKLAEQLISKSKRGTSIL
jgi:small GTP-binding protein